MSLCRDSIISLGSKLPPALGIFGRLRTLLDDSDCDVEAISELVEMDPALTFQVIRLSNSATYGLGVRCQSLDEAIGRVGFNEIHQLVGLIVSRQVFQGDLTQYGISASRLWENAVATGALASVFAARAGHDAGGAYSAGLLRNIGKVILNNQAGTAVYPGEEAIPDLFAWEKASYGITSPEATATLLDHWRFPLEIAGAICTHVTPETAAEFTAGAAILHLACGFATEWGSGLRGETSQWRCEPEMYELAGIDEGVLEGAAADARRQFSRFALLEWPKSS